MEFSIMDIYNRQDDLIYQNLYDESVMVIGLGGIGSWVALDLALLGVGTVIIIDPDVIEASNLNRTLFRLKDIGRKKVDVIKELIEERRNDIIVVPIEGYFTMDVFDKYKTEKIFDCTDNLKSRELLKGSDFQALYVKCGYDGYSATVSINDFEAGQWGDGGSYTIVPSFFGTPQVISALAVIELMLNDNVETRTINFESNKLLELARKEPAIENGSDEEDDDN